MDYLGDNDLGGVVLEKCKIGGRSSYPTSRKDDRQVTPCKRIDFGITSLGSCLLMEFYVEGLVYGLFLYAWANKQRTIY